MRRSNVIIAIILLAATVGLVQSVAQTMSGPYTVTSTFPTSKVIIFNSTITVGKMSTTTVNKSIFTITYHSISISKITRTSSYISTVTSTMAQEQALAWTVMWLLVIVPLLLLAGVLFVMRKRRHH